MEFSIQKTWNNRPVDHDPVQITLSEDPGGCRVDVKAPFFNSPPSPAIAPGQSCPQLWDFEVVEVFFLNDKKQYLEVELCPHGQHLVLLLNGTRNVVQEGLSLDYKCGTQGAARWQGSAVIPAAYFPPAVTRFNAYAIHGEGEARTYEALYPAMDSYECPDFHRLQYFGQIDLDKISPKLATTSASSVWEKHAPVST